MIEIYRKQTLGYSTEGMIASDSCYRNTWHYDTINEVYVCGTDLFLNKDSTVYIRVRGVGNDASYSSNAGEPTVFVSYEQDDGSTYAYADDHVGINHTHEYGYNCSPYYQTIGSAKISTQHYSYCWKDDEYKLENHLFTYKFNPRTRQFIPVCLKCGFSA